VRRDRDGEHEEGNAGAEQHEVPDEEDHARPESARAHAELGWRRCSAARVVPNAVRDQRHEHRDHRGPVKTGFAIECLEESINEVLGIERHGLAILAALRALLSVSDRTGLDAFARGLQDLGWELIATDGTRAALAAEGITSRSVEDVTGQPSLL